MSDYYDIYNIIEELIKEENEVSWEDESVKNKKISDSIENSGNKASSNDERKPKKDSESVDEDEEDLDDDSKDEEVEEDETPDESPSTINLKDALIYEKFVDCLNQFRAAHSFNSDDIKEELTDYFDKLSDDEKKVLHIFVKGLIQVTMMDVKGKVAYSPSDLRYEIKKTGSVESEKIRSKKRAQDAGKDVDEKETNAPVDVDKPIKIGESVQDKSKILKIIYSNR